MIKCFVCKHSKCFKCKIFWLFVGNDTPEEAQRAYLKELMEKKNG